LFYPQGKTKHYLRGPVFFLFFLFFPNFYYRSESPSFVTFAKFPKLAEFAKPSRAHCLTIANPVEDLDPDLLNELSHGNLRYCVWQLERGTNTGLVHFQAYVEWIKPCRAAVFKRWSEVEPTDLARCHFSTDDDLERYAWCGGIHVSIRVKSREAARQYCMVSEFKGADKGRIDGPWEWGDWSAGGHGTRNDLASAATFIKGGGSVKEVAGKWPTTFVRYERGLRSLQQVLAPLVFRDVEGWYIWGDTGVGKSYWVYQTFGIENVYVVANESPLWMDGYSGQPVLFFEEFDSLVPIKALLRIVDGYPYDAPVKGGFVRGLWTRVVITGNSDVTGQWPPELKRRFGFPHGLGDRGNVRHCRWVGDSRVGFPTAAEVGGGGPFTMARISHVVRRPVVDVVVPACGSAAAAGAGGDVSSSDVGLAAGSGGLGGAGGGGPESSFSGRSPVEQILPSFSRCADGIVRQNSICSDVRCVACASLRPFADDSVVEID